MLHVTNSDWRWATLAGMQYQRRESFVKSTKPEVSTRTTDPAKISAIQGKIMYEVR